MPFNVVYASFSAGTLQVDYTGAESKYIVL